MDWIFIIWREETGICLKGNDGFILSIIDIICNTYGYFW